MNSSELKYQNGLGNNIGTKAKSTKKGLFTRVPNKAVLSVEDQELLKIATQARDEWIENNSNFEHVSDELLVDYYTYRIKASEAKYAYFLQLVKEKGLSRYL